MTRERKKFQPLTSENICNIYRLLYSHGYVSFPLEECAIDKIDSLVSSINSAYFGQAIYKSNEEKAVAYLYFIIKNHVFVDGNKRTASLAFSILCDLNDLVPKYADFTLDEIVVLLEQYNGSGHQQLIESVAELLFA
jgi:prophage maintenance system killer protein